MTAMRRISILAAVAASAAFGAVAATAGNSTATAAPFPAAGQLRVNTLVVRARPDARSAKVVVLHQFRRDFRPQEVLALAQRTGADGKTWLQLSLPMRPNGTKGWVPASTVGVHPIRLRIVVHRGSRRLELYRGSSLLYRTTVAVGRPGMETPLGSFYVTARFVPDNSFLGTFAFETSAYSKLTEWPGGGVVGIHGTSMPQLLGQAVSHGCIRISNTAADVLKRYVMLGTPVSVVAN